MERRVSKLNPARRGTAVCVLLLLALFALLLARAPYGFDWTDEPYYSVLPYRLALGDRLLIDTWEVHQFSGLLALPFLQLYRLFSGGSVAGLMLYFRYVLICVQLCVSLYAFLVLRRKSGNLPAFLCAGLLLMHVHYGLNGFSYNAMSPLLCMLSALLAFDALDGTRAPLKAALCGVFYALSVQAYPYFALSVPVYGVFWWRYAVRRRGEPMPKRLPLCFLAGVLATAAAFAAYVCLGARGGDLLAGIRGMLGDPDHVGESVFLVLAQYVNAIRVLFGPVFTGAAFACVWCAAACWWKNPRQKQRMRQIGLWLCALLVLGAVAWVIPYDYPNHHKINLAAMSLALLAPALYFLSGRKADRSMLLFFLGLALSVAVQLGSNTRIRSSSGMLLPASIGALLYLFDCTDGIVVRTRAQRLLRIVLAGACTCQLLLTAGLRMVTVYRDAPLKQLDTVISEGPARGIATTAANANDYAAVYTDLSENAPETGYLLVTNLLPVAYLMTSLPPAAPSTFNMTVDTAWLALYYRQNPARLPDCVFAADAEIGQSNDVSLSGMEQLPLLTGRTYIRQSLPSGTLFTG